LAAGFFFFTAALPRLLPFFGLLLRDEGRLDELSLAAWAAAAASVCSNSRSDSLSEIDASSSL